MSRVRVKGFRFAGFTLIELMIVIAIIAVLALILIPKMGRLIQKSNEAATRGHLGSMRSALSIYYSDQEGTFPVDLSPFLTPGSKFVLDSPPKLYTAVHGIQTEIDYYAAQNPLADTGYWGYVSGGTGWGVFWVACTHQDLSFKVWSAY